MTDLEDRLDAVEESLRCAVVQPAPFILGPTLDSAKARALRLIELGFIDAPRGPY